MKRATGPRRAPLVIRNETLYETHDVRNLIRWVAKQIDLSGVCVNVRHLGGDGCRAGKAYDHVPSISNAPPSSRYLMTLRLVRPEFANFPYEWGYRWGDWNEESGRYNARALRGGPPVFLVHNWQEALVALTAHEATHIEQYREGLARSEVRCEWNAYHFLQQWRLLTKASGSQEAA